ncbi:hypothetical protein JW905_10315, partial [bacterium]|nr:hypothetical protein [candidate division CSSED10-310 bacterium]
MRRFRFTIVLLGCAWIGVQGSQAATRTLRINGGDTCDTAPDISAPLAEIWVGQMSICMTADTMSASDDYSPDCPGPCGYMDDTPEVVWKFTPYAPWKFRINNCTEGSDWSVMIYVDDCPGEEFACDDDSCGDGCLDTDFAFRTDCLLFDQGITYYVLVWMYNGQGVTSVCFEACPDTPTPTVSPTPTISPTPTVSPTPTMTPTFAPVSINLVEGIGIGDGVQAVAATLTPTFTPTRTPIAINLVEGIGIGDGVQAVAAT